MSKFLFLFKKVNKLTFSGNNELLIGVTMLPAVEKHCSDVADEAGANEYFFANIAKLEYFFFIVVPPHQ